MILKNTTDVTLLSLIRDNKNWRSILADEMVGVYNAPNNRVIIKYNSITKFNKELGWMLETRGPVIDLDTIEYVCRPLDKFWNFKEGNTEIVDYIDWDNAKYYEKLDGSLIKFWFDHKTDEWQCSTNGWYSAAETKIPAKFRGNNNEHGIESFADLVDYTIRNFYPEFENELLNLDKHSTHMFELCTPLNRVVVKHDTFKLFYLISRENKSGKEYKEDIKALPTPKEYDFKNFKECLKTIDYLPTSDEGYVIYDQTNGIRVKCKSIKYVAVHHLLEEDHKYNPKFHFRAVKSGELDEILAYIPELTDVLLEMNRRYSNLIKYLEESLEDAKNILAEHGPKGYGIVGRKYKYNVHIFEILKLKRFDSLDTFITECIDYKNSREIEAFNIKD